MDQKDENPCLIFFAENAENTQKVMLLQQQPRVSEFEQFTASDLSPGIVEEDETLLRQVFHPFHLEPDTGEMKPSAFDDAKDKGLSVDREKFRRIDQTVEAGTERAQIANANAKEGSIPRRLHAIARLLTREVRALNHEGMQCFGVYDTAIEANRGHADVCQLVVGKQPARSARSRLVDLSRGTVILHEPGQDDPK